jgi:hypothetical protein
LDFFSAQKEWRGTVINKRTLSSVARLHVFPTLRPRFESQTDQFGAFFLDKTYLAHGKETKTFAVQHWRGARQRSLCRRWHFRVASHGKAFAVHIGPFVMQIVAQQSLVFP